MQFNFTYESSVSAQFKAVVEAAGAYYATLYNDPITINIQIGMNTVNGQPVTNGAIATAYTISEQQLYNDVRSALYADAKSAVDALALAAAPMGTPFSSAHLFVSRAGEKALGLIGAADGGVDGRIAFGSQYAYDFDSSDGVSASSYDLFSVAFHEIGHVLGRQLYYGQGDQFSLLDLYHFDGSNFRSNNSGGFISANDTTDGRLASLDGTSSDFTINDGADPYSSSGTPGLPYHFTLADLGLNDIIGFDAVTHSNGTSNSEFITGTASSDTIDALAGDDIVYGGDGRDTINGGAGNDVLIGEKGLYLAGWDFLTAGDDIINGGDGDDFIIGGLGNDLLNGGNGKDKIYNSLADSNGNGNVQFRTDTDGGNDVIDGGGGADHAYLIFTDRSASININLTSADIVATILVGGVASGSIVRVEGLDFFGGSGADTINLSGLSSDGSNLNWIEGRGGDDTITGGSGSDRLDGGSGTNTLTGGGGQDYFLADTFNPASNGFVHTVTDFNHKQFDKVAIQKFAWQNYADIKPHITTSAGGTTIDLGTGTITIAGAKPLYADDIQLNGIVLPEFKGHVTDVNGDHISDVLWRNVQSGTLAAWQMDAGAIVSNSSLGFAPTLLDVSHDFNRDGKADKFYRDFVGNVYVSSFDGPTNMVANINTNWRYQGAGDFNGDGITDAAWREVNGGVSVWQMNGAQITQNTSMPTIDNNWKMQGIGDFNGDGKSDVLWRHLSGQVVFWQMDGTTIKENRALNAQIDLSWHVAGIGDFNGDGKSDIVWRHNTGFVSLWEMSGYNIASNTAIANVDNTWKLEAIGDYTDDGKSDLLWRNNGFVAMWQMAGSHIADNFGVGAIDGSWTIASANPLINDIL